jgi:hypothetical protein
VSNIPEEHKKVRLFEIEDRLGMGILEEVPFGLGSEECIGEECVGVIRGMKRKVGAKHTLWKGMPFGKDK